MNHESHQTAFLQFAFPPIRLNFKSPLFESRSDLIRDCIYELYMTDPSRTGVMVVFHALYCWSLGSSIESAKTSRIIWAPWNAKKFPPCRIKNDRVAVVIKSLNITVYCAMIAKGCVASLNPGVKGVWPTRWVVSLDF